MLYGENEINELSAKHALANGVHEAISTLTKYGVIGITIGVLLYAVGAEKTVAKKIKEFYNE